MKKIVPVILAVTSAVLSVPAVAQFAKAEDAVKYRKSVMYVMQHNFGRVAAMAAGRIPMDAKVAVESAAIAELMSKLAWPAFGEGTDKGETRAKPEIWKESAKYKEYSDNLQLEMGKLSTATKTGNLDSIKAAVNATGGSCKTCHDAYRKD